MPCRAWGACEPGRCPTFLCSQGTHRPMMASENTEQCIPDPTVLGLLPASLGSYLCPLEQLLWILEILALVGHPKAFGCLFSLPCA
jgi:hypothetical protein